MPKRFSQKCILSDAIILCCSNSTFIFVRFCSFWPCGQQLTVLFEKWEFCQEGCHCNLISIRSFCACRAMHTGLVWTTKTGKILIYVENSSGFFLFIQKFQRFLEILKYCPEGFSYVEHFWSKIDHCELYCCRSSR